MRRPDSYYRDLLDGPPTALFKGGGCHAFALAFFERFAALNPKLGAIFSTVLSSGRIEKWALHTYVLCNERVWDVLGPHDQSTYLESRRQAYKDSTISNGEITQESLLTPLAHQEAGRLVNIYNHVLNPGFLEPATAKAHAFLTEQAALPDGGLFSDLENALRSA